MKPELKPCPFCGSTPKLIDAGWDMFDGLVENSFCVDCDKCDTSTSWYDTPEQAAKSWNTNARYTAESLKCNCSRCGGIDVEKYYEEEK